MLILQSKRSGNPHHWHTLKEALKQMGRFAERPGHAFVEIGYRGHRYTGEVGVFVGEKTGLE